MSRASTADRRRGGCPVCGKAAAPGREPFCSQGCRDRDLLNWLGEGYRVAGPPAGVDSEGDASL